MSDPQIVEACPEDLSPVLTLLADASLPREGVAEHFQHFLVARAEGQVVGAVGLELYGSGALLRSLVVAPPHRGQRLGQALTARLLQEAKKHGVRSVFLLTETADGFFPKFGFRRITRDTVDPAVQASVEFQTACSESTVCMCLEL